MPARMPVQSVLHLTQLLIQLADLIAHLPHGVNLGLPCRPASLILLISFETALRSAFKPPRSWIDVSGVCVQFQDPVDRS